MLNLEDDDRLRDAFSVAVVGLPAAARWVGVVCILIVAALMGAVAFAVYWVTH